MASASQRVQSVSTDNPAMDVGNWVSALACLEVRKAPLLRDVVGWLFERNLAMSRTDPEVAHLRQRRGTSRTSIESVTQDRYPR